MAQEQRYQPHYDGESRSGDLREEPVGKLVHDFLDESRRVLSEGKRILRSEVDSAKAEVRAEAKKLAPAAGLAGGGGVLAHTAVLMLAVSLGALLSEAMPVWAGFLIAAVVIGAGAAALLLAARKRFTAVQLKPANTLQRLEEDQRWTRGLMQSAQSNLQRDT